MWYVYVCCFILKKQIKIYLTFPHLLLTYSIANWTENNFSYKMNSLLLRIIVQKLPLLLMISLTIYFTIFNIFIQS